MNDSEKRLSGWRLWAWLSATLVCACAMPAINYVVAGWPELGRHALAVLVGAAAVGVIWFVLPQPGARSLAWWAERQPTPPVRDRT